MKKFKLILSVMCLLILSTAFVSADDYVPPPGVLSPDEVDFGGKTVTICTEVRRGMPDNSQETEMEQLFAEAEKLFNVKIDTLELNNVEQLMARIMAGDSKYDIIGLQHRQGYFPLVSSDMLLPADDYLPEEFFEWLPNIDRYTIKKLKYQGKRYGIAINNGVVNDSMMIMSYNKDLIEQYNQPDPYELYLNGEWTYDALEQIASALTMDTDGDGVIDQRGITDVGNAAAFIRFAPSNGAEIAVQENGKWVYAYNRENAIHALNTITRWKELGIMGSGEYNAGEVGFVIHTHLGGNRHAKNEGINYGLVPMPMGPHVDRYNYPVFNFFITCLPVNAENPEALIALANFLFRENTREGLLDQMINEWMVTREHLEMYMTAIDNWRGEGDMFQNSGLWDIVADPIQQVLAGNKGAAQAMDEVAQQAQAFLDDLFKY